MKELIDSLDTILWSFRAIEYTSDYILDELKFITEVKKGLEAGEMIHPTDYLLALIIATSDRETSKKYTFKLLGTDLFDNAVYDMSLIAFVQVMDFYSNVAKEDELKALKEALLSNKKNFLQFVKRYSNLEKKLVDYIKYADVLYKEMFEKDFERMKKFFQLLSELEQERINYVDALARYYVDFDELESVRSFVEETLEAEELNFANLSREEKRYMKSDIQKDFEKNTKSKIVYFTKPLQTFLWEEQQKENRYKKALQKKIKAIESILRILRNYGDDEFIIFSRELEVLCDTLDCASDIKEDIFTHNEKVIARLKENINKLKRDTNSDILNVFLRQNLDINKLGSYHKKLLRSGKNYNEVEVIIEKFKTNLANFNLETPLFGKILIETDIEVLDKLITDLKIGIIDEAFLQLHPEIFTDRLVYERYLRNLSIIEEFNIRNVSGRINNIILIDSELLRERLAISCNYEIDLNNADTLDFLATDHFSKNIDAFIELDLLDLVLYYPSNLMIDDDALKRLIIYAKAGVPFRNENRLFSAIVTGKNALVKASELDEYMINNNYTDSYTSEMIDTCPLDELYMINDYLYEIEGILISRKRVLHNLATGYSLLDAIIVGSIITSMEFKNIKNTLEEQVIPWNINKETSRTRQFI